MQFDVAPVSLTPDTPGPFVVWAGDDGYDTQAGYFSLLASSGIKGTFFLSVDWVDRAGTSPVYGDAYITTSQVAAIVAAGHEIATHGKDHEDLAAYYATYGPAALDLLLGAAIGEIQTRFGYSVKTGSYPGGSANNRVKEIVSRRHEYFRCSRGIVSRNAPDPFDVPGIDILAPSESDIKAYIDEAVANRSIVVLFHHGSIDSAQLTKVSNLITYASGLGCEQGTFYQAMSQRTRWVSTRAMIDAQGNAFNPTVHTNAVIVDRDDGVGGYYSLGLDESTNAPYMDATGGTPFEFRKELLALAALSVGRRRVFADFTTTNASTTVSSGSAGFRVDDVGISISGTGIPAATTIAAVVSPTQATLSAAATASATNVTVTLGRPAPGGVVSAGGMRLYDGLSLFGTGSQAVYFERLESTVEGFISSNQWVNNGTGGAGGEMAIDSGSGGSYVNIIGFATRIRSQDDTIRLRLGAAKDGIDFGAAEDVTLQRDGSGNLAANVTFQTDGDLIVGNAGNGLLVKEGTNARLGAAALSSGSVTVSTSAVTANSRIFLTPQNLSGVGTPQPIGVSARTAGTSFTITSASSSDASTIAWMIVEPA
ncbi:Peptidoglycan/xylan/chitin deacetylase, PgdA/CDA1 family [Parafrankia irregularis]|uniref:Peptidoglycan/xylan/chitin deacetylase, PgdA/CDA1 family n=1 Tax=Parafrankia irregularis TaxID=795642 RepID=A0A0S4QSM5_9ACTN|nr:MULTISPECIES: polysaccharide deacetylase family protein [Parafrankia]MBE3202664.1 polysaccharide deacetylase family protein [Parafrankia sp. CH37]CUU57848.1 Peptidoglycan/xylan/chitin deacetylase, PgdA/CDA1 family [Parafrankia irregularis]